MKPNDSHIVTASSCISGYFLDAWGIDADAVLETETVSPKTLLTAGRLDLACKLYYLDCLEKGIDTAFAEELYQAHIEAFSGGAFIEPGLKTKNSIRDYLESFRQLIADMREKGFDAAISIVPVGDDGSILDGSHRVATAIYYDIPLTIVHIPGQKRRYDYAYFKERGLRETYLDFMTYQYIRFSDRVYTVCLWPAACDEKKLAVVDQMIRSCAAVAYRREVFLNYHGVEKLMVSFYRHMEWTGSLDNGFSGVASKARLCYRANAPTTVYVISGADLDQVLALKQRIRDLYAIENSSIHITDSHEEAVEAGRMLLFQNSIDFMNDGDPFRNTVFIKEFARRAESSQPCAGMDTTLALYGIGAHDACDDDDVGMDLQHPGDCFYFWGVRLPSLDYVKVAKKRSGSPQDLEDVRLIEAFERRKRSAGTASKERIKQALGSVSQGISGFFNGLRAETARTAKVAYHRIRYRKQRTGKGKKNIEDLQAAFLDINTTTADYLIMRNWEGFYDDILLEGHNDIDLLCRDRDTRDIIVRLLDARPLTADGFHYCFQYRGQRVTLDTRILGDGYYDRGWQRNMLNHKRLHPLGFYVMDSENYYYSLIYHAIYQKKEGLSEEYAQRLNQMSPADEVLTQDGFADQLHAFMRRNRYAYTVPMDKSVIQGFANTSIRKKVRYSMSIRIRRLAQAVKGKQLLQRLKIRIRKLMIRG